MTDRGAGKLSVKSDVHVIQKKKKKLRHKVIKNRPPRKEQKNAQIYEDQISQILEP